MQPTFGLAAYLLAMRQLPLPVGTVVALFVLVSSLVLLSLVTPGTLPGWLILLLLGIGIGALSFLWIALLGMEAHPRRNGLIVGVAVGLLFLLGFRLQAKVDPIAVGVCIFSGLVAGVLVFRDSRAKST